MKKIWIIALFAITSCTATTAQIADTPKPAADNAATVIYFRQGGFSLAPTGTTVHIDGKEVLWVGIGEFARADITPGDHTIAVSRDMDFGSCSLPFSVSARETIYFEVTTRKGHAAAFALFGFAGSAAATASGGCSGAYEIKRADPVEAKEKIASLNQRTSME